jgi:hypothetical protein
VPAQVVPAPVERLVDEAAASAMEVARRVNDGGFGTSTISIDGVLPEDIAAMGAIWSESTESPSTAC